MRGSRRSSAGEPESGPALDERLRWWLAERCGVTDYRRVVWRDARTVMLSKFEDGFAQHLHDVLERVPEIFDDAEVRRRYAEMAAAPAELTRVAAWRAATDAIVSEVGTSRGVAEAERAAIRGGLDSVAALLDSVLWSGPLAAEQWVASTGEREAFADVLARMESDSGLFTRVYGVFEGATVVGYCPASRQGRMLFEQAWKVCMDLPE